MALLADTPVALPVSAPQDAYNNYEQRPLHSPPQATPSSYGNAMPKRARAGSVSRSRTNSVDLSLSSRLRSASELEKAGLVSSTQKGALKDLIIFGDEALRGALDDYHQGDAERLERLVKQGYLDRSRGVNVSTVESRPREGSIDLLAELDLDSTAEVLFAARRPPPSAELFSTDDQLMGFDMEMPTLSSGLLVRARCPFFVATTRLRSRVDGVRDGPHAPPREDDAPALSRRWREGEPASTAPPPRETTLRRRRVDDVKAPPPHTATWSPRRRRRRRMRVHRERTERLRRLTLDKHRARTTYSQKGSGARGSVRWEASAPRGRTTAAGRGRAATPSPLNRRLKNHHRNNGRSARRRATL